MNKDRYAILVVDDSPPTRHYLKRLLEKRGGRSGPWQAEA